MLYNKNTMAKGDIRLWDLLSQWTELNATYSMPFMEQFCTVETEQQYAVSSTE